MVNEVAGAGEQSTPTFERAQLASQTHRYAPDMSGSGSAARQPSDLPGSPAGGDRWSGPPVDRRTEGPLSPDRVQQILDHATRVPSGLSFLPPNAAVYGVTHEAVAAAPENPDQLAVYAVPSESGHFIGVDNGTGGGVDYLNAAQARQVLEASGDLDGRSINVVVPGAGTHFVPELYYEFGRTVTVAGFDAEVLVTETGAHPIGIVGTDPYAPALRDAPHTLVQLNAWNNG